MKKRVKLLTTIASLCLAVALMAFGVYAATSVKATITTTISFTSTEISGTWTLKIDGVEQSGTTEGDTTTFTPALTVGASKTFAYEITFTNSSDTKAKVTVTVGDITQDEDSLSITEKSANIGSEQEVVKGTPAVFTFNLVFDDTKLDDRTANITNLGSFVVNGTANA